MLVMEVTIMVWFNVDDFSRYTWVFFLDEKSKVVEIFKSFAKRAQTEYELSLKHIRSDNGTEFKNTHIEDFLDDHGFTHEFSAAYTPQQNGVVERKIELLLRWPEPCLLNTRLPSGSGLKLLILLVISSTRFTFTNF